MYFFIFIVVLVTLRLSELMVARRNEEWLRANGALEYGKEHYPYIVLLHSCFILSLILEYVFRSGNSMNVGILIAFALLIIIKMFVIRSLGKYWNTKILHIHGVPLVRKGVYKYFKHPNYTIVVCEIVLIPLIFNLYITAILFSILNAIMLTIRIREENKILVDEHYQVNREELE